MATPKTIDNKFLSIEKRGGIFVIFAIIGIVAVAFFIGLQQNMFTPKVNIYFVSNSGKNIKTGAKVVFNGFKIGKISSVNLEEAGNVKAELSINRDYIKWIKKDSVARLMKELAIGDSIIDITKGSENTKIIAENDFIAFERARWFPAMEDEINTIPITLTNSPFITDIITELKTELQGEINPVLENVKLALKNFRTLSEDALITRQYLDSMYQNADSNLNELNTLVTQLNVDIPNIIKSVNKSLDSINLMATDFRKVTINAFAEIIEVINDGATILGETEDVVDAVKQIWPISSKIRKRADIKEQIIKVDSYE